MQKLILRSFLLLACGFAAVHFARAQTPSYVGTWVLDTSKSKLAGIVWTVEKTPSGHWHTDFEGIAYHFDFDGKDYAVPDGTTASWRASMPRRGRPLPR